MAEGEKREPPATSKFSQLMDRYGKQIRKQALSDLLSV